ncbi:MAG: acyl-CoA thioesterase [Anaerolineales bacterium]|nr:acyl-CoA thioesterase [Anaerolineales bacterium]
MNHTGYPYEYVCEIRFRDIDGMGHLNNAVYFTYMESARIHFIADLLETSELNQLGIILGEISCRYLSPAVFGESVAVGQAVTRFGTKSFDLEYQLVAVDRSGATGRKLAQGKATLVGYDYANQCSAVVPEFLKEKIRQQQPNWPIRE